MTEAELRKMFPNASGGFLKANHGSFYENIVERRITQKKHELKDELNKERRHWAVQLKEKKIAWEACRKGCESNSQVTGSNPSIQTTLLDQLKTASIFSTEAGLSKATSHGKSSSKLTKKKLNITKKKKLK